MTTTTTHQDSPPAPLTYTIVFVALLLLLVLTVAAAFVDLSKFLPGHGWGIVVALSIAILKTLLIMLYFMHLRGAPGRVLMFATAGFLWLAIMVTLTMSDYLTRNHPAETSPKGEPRYIVLP